MNALVINGTGSIGSVIVEKLKSISCEVIFTSNHHESDSDSGCINWKYDGAQSVEDLFGVVKNNYDSLDSVVNCLGSIYLKPAHLTDEKDFDKTLDINLRSSFFILKQSIPLMRKKGGNILFFSSGAAQIGLVNHEAIAAAKSGLEGLVRSAAATYSKYGIRINALALGLIESNLSSNIMSNPISLEMSKKMHALGEVGTPEAVSKFAIPLINDISSWVTGSVINIDGGLSTTKIAS